MYTMRISVGDVRRRIAEDPPRLIAVTGKTCTSKSTFARRLKAVGYHHIELDTLVREKVAKKFCQNDPNKAFSVYKGTAPLIWQESFESGAKALIEGTMRNSRVVVDTAIGDSSVLNRIFSCGLSDFLCLFFHPFNRDFYLRCILKRFLTDLNNGTRRFDLSHRISTDLLEDFQANGASSSQVRGLLDSYCTENMLASEKRFRSFEDNSNR